MGKMSNLIIAGLLLGAFVSCSVQKMAVNSVADALSGSTSGVFATDDLPEFVGEAVPFGLKLNEAILEQTPEHKGLLLSLASGYAQYSYAFVQLPADTLTPPDMQKTKAMKSYAKKLYLRSRYYGFRCMEVDHPGFKKDLFSNPEKTLDEMVVEDVPALYWLGLSWMGAISITMSDLSLLAELTYAEKILFRCLELDESYGEGALREFFVTYDGSRNEAMGGGVDKARVHYERALELSKGRKASPYVALATTVSINTQDVEEFRSLLGQALAVDLDAYPKYKLENTIAQRKANYYLKNIGDYFLLDDEGDDDE